jgi:hypothetical protein
MRAEPATDVEEVIMATPPPGTPASPTKQDHDSPLIRMLYDEQTRLRAEMDELRRKQEQDESGSGEKEEEARSSRTENRKRKEKKSKTKMAKTRRAAIKRTAKSKSLRCSIVSAPGRRLTPWAPCLLSSDS